MAREDRRVQTEGAPRGRARSGKGSAAGRAQPSSGPGESGRGSGPAERDVSLRQAGLSAGEQKPKPCCQPRLCGGARSPRAAGASPARPLWARGPPSLFVPEVFARHGVWRSD